MCVRFLIQNCDGYVTRWIWGLNPSNNLKRLNRCTRFTSRIKWASFSVSWVRIATDMWKCSFCSSGLLAQFGHLMHKTCVRNQVGKFFLCPNSELQLTCERIYVPQIQIFRPCSQLLPPSHFNSPVFLFRLSQIVVYFPIEECKFS